LQGRRDLTNSGITCAIDKYSQVWCRGASIEGLHYVGGGPPILTPTLVVA
jgi:hypothetical protein